MDSWVREVNQQEALRKKKGKHGNSKNEEGLDRKEGCGDTRPDVGMAIHRSTYRVTVWTVCHTLRIEN